MTTLWFGAAIEHWRQLLWPIGGVLGLCAIVTLAIWWWRHRVQQQQPILFLLEQLLWHFRKPLLMVTLGSLTLIAMGFAAGSQFSMILFVSLSALTVVGLGFVAYWLWPRDSGDGNLFDLVPLPDLEWPAFENSKDRMMRSWVAHRTHQMKTNPPAFSGATFGAIALEVSKEASEIYEKHTPLSVSLDDMLRGVERTAADLKILCNHLPLAGHFTLAAIERQIEFAARRGRLLYAMIFLLLSFFNPGNLIRVLLAFIQQKSPWNHLLVELQGWVYGHYTERLGYHMALIHSRRSPPPPDALHKAFAEQEKKRGEAIRLQKLGWLAFLGLFGFAVYLGLQLINVTMVYGALGFLLGLGCLGLTALGVWQLRAPVYWQDLWKAILPSWPDTAPTEGSKEFVARRQMAAVLRTHKQPPPMKNSQDAKRLAEFYGELMLSLWQACYSAYQTPDESDPDRTSREFYLPQGFAGVEELCRALHEWFNSTSLLPRTIRQLERFGLNLETIYLYIKRQSDQAQAEAEQATSPEAKVPQTPPQKTDTQAETTASSEPGAPIETNPDEALASTAEADHPAAIKANDTAEAAPPAETALALIKEPPASETRSEAEAEAEANTKEERKGVLGWFGKVGRSLGNLVKDVLIGQVHQKVLKLMGDGVGERLLNIYGARHTNEAFAPRKPVEKARSILLLGRDPQQCELVLQAIVEGASPPLAPPEPTIELSPANQWQTDDGWILQIEIHPMPSSEENTEEMQAIADLLLHQKYHRIVLIDEIDYGARERIARLLQHLVDQALRTSEVGSMALALVGVEKLKPLSWEPPYDDYLEEAPQRRKSQRIRSAVLAWSEVITHIPSMESIYPIGIPNEGQPWGLASLQRFVGLPVTPTSTAALTPASKSTPVPTSTSEPTPAQTSTSVSGKKTPVPTDDSQSPKADNSGKGSKI